MEQNEAKLSLTRDELRKAQKTEAEAAAAEESESEKIKWRVRIIPIWLRIIIIAAVMIIAIASGAMFGYGVLGGGSAMDVFKMETWQHIIDLVKKD